MKNNFFYSFLILLFLQTLFMFGQSLVANSTGSFTYTPPAPLNSKPITVFYHIPAGNINTMPILFAFHGDDRDGANYRDYWVSMANANGFMVFAPQYSEASYPGGSGYQMGNVFVDGDNPSLGTFNTTNLWTFSTVDPLFETIKTAVSGTQQTYDAWGHSGGAQFLHRFRMYLPNSKLNTAICSNAGWYTVPEISVDFPYGSNKSQLTNPNLLTAFSKRLIVHLGLDDNDPYSPGLRHNNTVDNQQGVIRLERGRYFFNKSLVYSQALGNTFNWQREEVSGVGHDPQLMANNALRFLFQTTNNTVAFSVIDGGFENQTTGSIPFGSSGAAANLSTTVWTANTNASNTRFILNTGGRSGPKYAQFGPNGTGTERVYYTPQLPNGFLIPNISYQIQFYYKTATTATLQASSVNLYVNNTSLTQAQPITPVQSAAAGLSTNINSWTKVSVSLATNTTASGANGLASITLDANTGGTYTADIDDFVIYQGASPDVTAPNSPGAISASGAANGQANVSWAAASSVDGGGYLVVRYATNAPLTTDDPMTNGIYNFSNTIGNGIVRYSGTGTSFTDNGLSPGVDYYYKVYTVDKAFNYSNESVMAAPVQALATTYYYKGSGLLTAVTNWGLNTDGTGTAPLNFTDTSQVFEIRNTTAVSLDGTWIVGGASANGTIVRLGNNSQAAVRLTLNSGASIGPSGTGNVDVVAPSSGSQTVVYRNTTALSFGIISDPNFVIVYDGVTASSNTTRSFSNVNIINGASITFGSNLTITNLVVNSLSTVIFGANPIIKNITVDVTSSLIGVNNASFYITIPISGSVIINGTARVARLSGFVTSVDAISSAGGFIQFVGIENLILGANSTVEYVRDATGSQTISPRTDYGNLILEGTAPKIISGNASLSGSLTINSGTLTVNSGSNLTVTNAVVNNGTLTIQNNANLIQVNNLVNSGNGTTIINRNSSPVLRSDYTLWSSPVSGQSLTAFSPLTLQDPGRFYSYNTTYNTGGANGAFAEIANPSLGSANFTAGAGYLIRMPNTANAITPTAFAGVFTGTSNNGDIPVTLVDGGTLGLRYNLVGNPYPSPISIATFVSDNATKIESTFYFWRKTNAATGSAYCTYNAAGSPIFTSNGNVQSVDPAGVIQTGQGFFVEAKTGATSLTFKNGQRVANTVGQFFKRKQVASPSRIWLNATTTEGAFSQMAINYADGATQGLDDYDSKYINDSPMALTSNINNEEYTIQGRPAFQANDVVALNFKTNAAGVYTIAIDHTEGVFASGQDIYLVDNKTGAETNLKDGAYNFTAASGKDNSRFSLKYQRTLKVGIAIPNDNSVQVYKNSSTLYVNSTAKSISSIQVRDVQGRLIAEQKNVKSNTATITNLNAVNLVLIVRVTSEDNSEVTKKILN